MWLWLKKRSSRIIYKTLKFPDVISHKALWISNAVAFSKHFSELCVNQSVTEGLNFSPNTQEPKKSGEKSAVAEFNLVLSHSEVSKQCLEAFLKLKPYYFLFSFATNPNWILFPSSIDDKQMESTVSSHLISINNIL